MKKLIQNFYIFLSIYTSVTLFATEPVTIASSPANISYYKLAESMKTIFYENKSEFTIVPIETHGSIDNIKKLIKHEVNLAIVQSDIVFFAKNGLGPFKSEKQNLRIILPLFKEPIFLLTKMQTIHRLSEISNKRVALGEVNSGLSASAKVILNSANIWNSIEKYNFPEKQALKKLKQGKVDIIFVNNLTNEMKKLISKGELSIIPIRSSFIKKLQKTFPYFYAHKFSLNDSNSVSTIAVRAVLITTADMNPNKIYKITNLLVKNYNSLLFPDKYHTPKNELFKVDIPIDWHKGVEQYFQKNNITPSSGVIFDRYFWYIIAASILIVILLVFTVSIIMYNMGLLYTLKEDSKFLIFLRKVYLHAIKYKYVLIIIFMILSYAVSILLIQYFEHSWAILHNVSSTFDENPFVKSLLWLFIFGTTGYNGNFFPSSSEGKLIVSLIPMIGLGGFFALVGLVTSDQIKKYILEGKGMSKINFKDHIIICGWNEKTPLLVEDLTHKNLSNKRPLVILSDNLDFNPIDKFNLNREYVKYVSGSGTDREALRKANLVEAEFVIVISDAESSDPDARTILNVLTIEKFSSELIAEGKRIKKQIYTIAELIDKKNEQTAKDANVNQVIALGDIESKVFAQSVQNPGVMRFVDEIFTYNDDNDIYSIVVDATCNLLGKTYDEILLTLRKHNILLLSINIESRRTEAEVNNIITKFGLFRSVITNPIRPVEQEYKVQHEDTLLVLARYEKDLIQARKYMHK